MSYITKYGIYIPHFTIGDKILNPNGRDNNHSIAYVDEDIITMAYQAVLNSKFELGNPAIDAVIFATTSRVFTRRYHASYLADLLGLPQGITAMDTGTTNRAGSDALVLADTMIASRKHNNILVVASDIHFPLIGKEAKNPFGHAATAILVSSEPGIAEITSATSYSAALAEDFKYKGEKVQYDPRFARNVGFKENMKFVLADLNSSEIDYLSVNSAYVRLMKGALKKAGFDMEKQISADTLVPRCGYTGSAHGLMRLIHAVDLGKGTAVLVDYNNGSNVISVKTENAAENLLEEQMKNKAIIATYQDYLVVREQGKFKGSNYKSTEMFSSEMIQEREKDQLLHLKGFECKECGTLYYMKAARCNNCKKSEFTEKQLSKTGTVYTLTGEHYFPCSFPPTNMIVIDLDGGGRVTLQQTDDMYQNEFTKLSIGDKVELVLRKMMETDSKPNYFWKCKKVRNAN